MTARPLIAIVGRPNVGKSRLFNRLIGRHQAIVEDFPGVTRDRQYGEGEWYGKAFAVVDTGGFEPESEDVLLSQMREQAQLALEEADIIFFVMDAREGLTPTDEEIARMLRNTEKPLFPIANKIDGARHDDLIAEFYALGFERVYPTSAEHGYQMDDLLDEVALLLPPEEDVGSSRFTDEDRPLHLAVIGKPNAGKSTLINKMLGQERLLTSDVPGTTRDAIDSLLERNGERYLLIDTAGVRRRKSISELMEKYSVVKAFKAIDRADVVLYMVNAEEGLTEQDKRLIRMTVEKGKPHVLLVNKWDALEKDNSTAGAWAKALQDELRLFDYAPILFISALTGQRVHRILETAQECAQEWTRRIGTGPLNRWFRAFVDGNPPPVHHGRRLKLYYASQVAIRPPTFMFTTNHPEAIHQGYERFLLNQLRKDFEFKGTPLKLFFRKAEDRKKEEATGE